MWKIVIIFLFFSLEVFSAEDSNFEQIMESGLKKIKIIKQRKAAINELKLLRKLVSESPEVPDQILLRGKYIGMMDQILRDLNTKDSCKNKSLEFKIRNYDYNDETFNSRAKVIQLTEMLELICNLK